MSGDTISTRILERDPDPELNRAWTQFIGRADFGTHYVAPEYFLEPDAYERRFLAILALRGANVVGVLTGERHQRHFIGGLTARPQIAFARGEDKTIIGRRLIETLLTYEQRVSLFDICTWEPLRALRGQGFWQRKIASGVVMLDLTKGADRLLAEMVGTRRTDIKKGIKNGVEVREATEMDAEAYLRICEAWARRKNLALPNRELHRRMLNLRQVRRLFIAVHDGQVIAGSIIRFCQNGIMEYAANSSIAEKMILKPNDVLQWRIIQWGCAHGFTRYSLGGSHPFLLKFGGQVIETCSYRLDRSFLRRHRLREIFVLVMRSGFRHLPPSVRKLLGSRHRGLPLPA